MVSFKCFQNELIFLLMGSFYLHTINIKYRKLISTFPEILFLHVENLVSPFLIMSYIILYNSGHMGRNV